MPFVSAPELKQNFEESYGSLFGGYPLDVTFPGQS